MAGKITGYSRNKTTNSSPQQATKIGYSKNNKSSEWQATKTGYSKNKTIKVISMAGNNNRLF